MSSRTDASAARQALHRIAQHLPKYVEAAMGVRGDVLAASLSKTRKICGKPNCKCARGEKHEVYQLSWTDNGQRRSTHIRRDELARVRAAVEQYRQLRKSRAELLKLATEAASLMDALVEALRVAPPDKSGGHHR
jgi:uncharacterized protein YjiS (DUF1127 family)